MEILRWDNVSFAYDSQFRIESVSHTLHKGDFTLFFGSNGSGKSTLFEIGAGFLKPKSGRVILDGRAIDQWAPPERAKRLAFLEQESHYTFPFTVEEIVLMGRFPYSSQHYWDRKSDLEVAAWAMERTGTLRFAKRSIFQLSSGERRKVEIARALCQKPKLLLLDEPATFLDIRQQLELFELLNRLNQEEQITIAMISHHLELAKRFVKEAVFIQSGCVMEIGPVHEMLAPGRVEKFFELRQQEAL